MSSDKSALSRSGSQVRRWRAATCRGMARRANWNVPRGSPWS